MTNLQLVFLHIPKTAGTSLRQRMNQAYRIENVFWIGVDCNTSTTKFPSELIGEAAVMGGHRGISFYPEDLSPIYCSVLRDPLERAVSLFAYYTRPDLAELPGQQRERENQLKRMLGLGIKPDSLADSIEQCAAFRSAISEQQCGYLSRGEANFAEALQTLRDNEFLVGSQASYNKFYGAMAAMLSWQHSSAARINTGRENYAREYLDDTRVATLVKELNPEDYKLWHFVEGENGGLYHNLPQGNDSRLAVLNEIRRQ